MKTPSDGGYGLVRRRTHGHGALSVMRKGQEELSRSNDALPHHDKGQSYNRLRMHLPSRNIQIIATIILCLTGILYYVSIPGQIPASLLKITHLRIPFSGNATQYRTPFSNNITQLHYSFDDDVNTSSPPLVHGDHGRIPESYLHLMVPATSSNRYLCQLLLSARILGYPAPTLINWAAKEDPNPYVQHIAKIMKILQYLRTLAPERNNDLVLIVDGYDVWFQLRPDVLIRRYFNVTRSLDQRVSSVLSPDVIKKHDIRHSVLFGPDKLCWPSGDGRRPACWAVPPTTLPENAFGEFDDSTVAKALKYPVKTRPRWLNSGTIMGTVEDVREVFEATWSLVYWNHTIDSDQYYFANVLGDQEYARTLLSSVPDLPLAGTVDVPDATPGNKSEYHIGIDYESAIFQNVGYYAQFLIWLFFDGNISDCSGTGSRNQTGSHNETGNENETAAHRFPHGYDLSDDIAISPPPFSVERRSHWVSDKGENNAEVQAATPRLPIHLSWRDMPLLTNTVTRQILPVVHFTIEKKLRDLWWNQTWFYNHSKELLQASVRAPQAPLTRLPINGSLWRNIDASNRARDSEVAKSKKSANGGAWSDKGAWVPWDDLCRIHNDAIFGEEKSAKLPS